jgi:phosphoserine phosphatase RsbU/P
MESDSPELSNVIGNFFEHPLCGFLITDTVGRITRANRTIAAWIGETSEKLKGRRFSDLLTIGGKIYYETHLGPLLRMQGFFDEVAVELNSIDGEKRQVLVNAFEHRNSAEESLFVQISVYKATDRRQYEQNLKEEKRRIEQSLLHEQLMSSTKEQFIAVLGHDLRNPLSSILTGASILREEPGLDQYKPILEIIHKSGGRMAELINNIMDFARARMGSGIVVNRKPTDLEPILQHVVDEIIIVWPGRIIDTDFKLTEFVDCDGPRIGQLLSNLLANALTHGTSDTPVLVRSSIEMNFFNLSVTNQGTPISESAIEKIFLPFSREEHRPSRQGLGLGLFIASEIARAHLGELFVHSDINETCFTLRFETSI